MTSLCFPPEKSVCNGETSHLNCTNSDQRSLLDFKNGLIDADDRLSSWRGGSNCCEWWGVTCDSSTGAVISLQLHNSSLGGEIRPSLLQLESLQHLDLSLDDFNDVPFPSFLGSFRSLEYLNLSTAGFSGIIPPALGNISTLQFLDLSSSQLSGLTAANLDWMKGMVSLKHLSMSGVDLSIAGSNLFRTLNMLPGLTEVHLSSCGLTGSSSLALARVNFTSLSVLDLSFNDFSARFPSWLANLTRLSHLDLSSNKLHGKLPDSIGNLSSLRDFDLFENNVEGAVPSSIGKLCNLQSLDFSGNNLTGSLPETLQETSCGSNGVLPNLQKLRLSSNRLVGKLPDWLGKLEALAELSLDNNLLQGPIPDSLGNLQNLTNLGISYNQLNGTLPDTFGKLSQLSFLDVSSNHLTGSISESHFATLAKLKILLLASNSLVFDVGSSWLPRFQARNLDLGSCQLGPSFPTWLRTQREVMYLDFSNASISDTIPTWFWDISSNLSLLNVSFNQLTGQLPNKLKIAPFADVDFSSNLFEGPMPLPSHGIELLDLSKNKFSGPIPEIMFQTMPDVIFLSLSGNRLSGDIPSSIGDSLSLQVIDLSNNSLSGNIPSTIGNCSFLKALDLSNNMLTGPLPSSFQNLTSLETMDLGNNLLSGNILAFLGDVTLFEHLRILRLRSNAFSGHIPPTISNLTSLQVLDLAENNLTGNIPSSLGDLNAMASNRYTNQYLQFGKYRGAYYEESLVVNIKGNPQKYTKTLSLVTSIDLSSNNLQGDFPEDVTKLVGLVSLNLSRNQITGKIPETISNMRAISSLDLSNNRLSGSIPEGMNTLTSLAYLNLSSNSLSGAIPTRGQMSTFEQSAFANNSGLCGVNIDLPCRGDDDDDDDGQDNNDGDEDGFIDEWFYLAVGVGFAAGIVIPTLVLAVKKPWSDAYFMFVDRFVKRSWLLMTTL
ncbi:Receptor-like protein EIX2 [Linum perenne]